MYNPIWQDVVKLSKQYVLLKIKDTLFYNVNMYPNTNETHKSNNKINLIYLLINLIYS
jgi:hypothetical protein